MPYETCLAYTEAAVETVRARNPEVRILITTSPVPLARTFAGLDVITANMYSKSVLRTVSGRLQQTHEYVDYVPSYESVVQSKTPEVWDDDLIHVSDAFVGKVVRRMTASFLEGGELEEERNEVPFHEAYVALREGRLEAARELGERLLERDPRDPRHLLLSALALDRLQRFEAAEEHAQRAVEASPQNRYVRILYGETLLHNGKPDLAAAQLEAALELPESGEEVLWHIGPRLDDAELRWRIGEIAREEGRLADALACFESASEARHEIFKFTYSRALVLQALDRADEAREIVLERRAEFPFHAGYAFSAALVLEQLGELEEALEHAEAAVELNPELLQAGALVARLRQSSASAGDREPHGSRAESP